MIVGVVCASCELLGLAKAIRRLLRDIHEKFIETQRLMLAN